MRQFDQIATYVNLSQGHFHMWHENGRVSLKYFPKTDEKIFIQLEGGMMKFFSNLRNRLRRSLASNNRGQGATEYILLLVVVVGMVIVFKDKIKTIVKDKTETLGNDINSVKSTD